MRALPQLFAVGIVANCLGAGCSGTASDATPTRPEASASAHQRCFRPRPPRRVKLTSARAADPVRDHHWDRFRPDGMTVGGYGNQVQGRRSRLKAWDRQFSTRPCSR